MRIYQFGATPEFEEQIANLFRYMAEKTSPDIAAQYTGAITEYCASLNTFSQRGILRHPTWPAHYPLTRGDCLLHR